MSRKGENIHKRKDGRWEARILIFSQGRKKYKSIYGRSYKEAKNKMLHYHQTIGEDFERNPKNPVSGSEQGYMLSPVGSAIPASYSDTVHTFSSVTEEWFQLNHLKQKESTKLKYRTMLNKHILPRFGDVAITDIDVFTVNIFLTEKISGGSLLKDSVTDSCRPLSTSYVRTMGVLISSVINFAVRMGYRNVLQTPITKPVEKKKSVNVMSKREHDKLEKYLKREHTQTGVGIMLALHAGLRIGEVCALRWDDIDFDEKILHVRHTVARIENKTITDKENYAKTKLIIDDPKTKSSIRDIPINSKLLLLLTAAKEKAVSDYVVSDKNVFLSPRTFEYRFHRLLRKYRIADINFHVLRHTFSTRCVELDVDIKSLSEVLGHSSVSTTLSIYVHSSMDLKRSQLEKLAV